MRDQDSHLSDEQLLLDLDGELPRQEVKCVRAHLKACWRCRVRRQELEGAVTEFIRFHQQEFDAPLPPIAGPRALLKARLAEMSATPMNRWTNWLGCFRRYTWAFAVALCCLLPFVLFLSRVSTYSFSHTPEPLIALPDAHLTPGATLLISRRAVCQQANVKNKAVPTVLQKKVFEEYGIAKAQPTAYEVDYLVTPALGGAADIHNLWPHSYSAAWNARVKDGLEDRLRELVCDGQLDLTEAQQEIATDWIAAYKKYFHTDRPLPVLSEQGNN